MKRIITFGTFDVFHIGHVRIIERAARLGNELYVGVSSDALNFSKKGRYPMYNEQARMDIVMAMKGVTHVFLEESLELKKEYIQDYEADILVMGDDWAGKFDWVKDACDVVYLPRTDGVSTTQFMQEAKDR